MQTQACPLSLLIHLLSAAYQLYVRILKRRVFVTVMMSDPLHPILEAPFVTSFWDEVEPRVRGQEIFEPARKCGVGVKYLASFVLGEYAGSGGFRRRKLADPVVVVHLALPQLLGCERDMKVPIEIATQGRNPLETPTHPLLERLQFFQRRSRNGDHADVAMVQMNNGRIVMVGDEGA